MQNGNKTRGTAVLGGAGMVSLWGASSLIKSIQRGTINVISSGAATATIAAVDLANSIITKTGLDAGGASGQPAETVTRVELTNATTVTASINSSIAANRVTGYEVIEFRPGVLKSVQSGTINSAAPSATATITGVDVNKAFVFNLGHITNLTTMQANTMYIRMELTNGTTVTQYNNGSFTVIGGYYVAEFF